MDIKKLLQSLLDRKVKFLVVGAWALPAYGFERMTGDIDIFIKPTRLNAKRTLGALKAIGYDVEDASISLLLSKKVLFRQYILQTDIHPFVAGVDFDSSWRNKVQTEIKGLKVFVPSLEDFLKMKKAANRPKDLEDIRILEKVREKK